MLKKLLGLLMVAILNIMPNTIFAAGAPVGDGQEEVYGGGGTACAADDLATPGAEPTVAAEEDGCGICFKALGALVADYDASPEGRRPDRLRMREHLKELTQALKDLLTIKIGTPEEPEDTDDRTVALHPEKTEAAAQHRFHANCIRMWLKRLSNCPMCRVVVDNDSRRRLGLEGLTLEQRAAAAEELPDLHLIDFAALINWDENTVRALFCAYIIYWGLKLKGLVQESAPLLDVGAIMLFSFYQLSFTLCLSSMLKVAGIIKMPRHLKLERCYCIFSLVFALAKNISLEKIFAANPHWLTKKELSDTFYKIKATMPESRWLGYLDPAWSKKQILDDRKKTAAAWFRFNPIHTYYDTEEICGMCLKNNRGFVNKSCGPHLLEIDYRLECLDMHYAKTLDLREQAHNINAHYRNTDNKIDFLKIATTIAKYAPYVVPALITAALYCQLPVAQNKKEMLRNMMAATAFFMFMTSNIIMHGGFDA